MKSYNILCPRNTLIRTLASHPINSPPLEKYTRWSQRHSGPSSITYIFARKSFKAPENISLRNFRVKKSNKKLSSRNQRRSCESKVRKRKGKRRRSK